MNKHEKRGRRRPEALEGPQGALAHNLDATAQALELPPWDYGEIALMGRVQVYIAQMKAGATAILKITERAEAEFQAWVNGDCIENQRHLDVLAHLREANRLLDGGGGEEKWNCPADQAPGSVDEGSTAIPTSILAG